MNSPASLHSLISDASTQDDHPRVRTPPKKCNLLHSTPPPAAERGASSDPTVEALINIFEDHRKHLLDAQPLPVKLSRQQHFELIEAINADPTLHAYIQDKVRIDYDPISRDFLIRMPSAVHDLFSFYIGQEIIDELRHIGERQEADADGRLAAEITGGLSSRILLEGNKERSPDGQFLHELARYPGLVFEISYNQKLKNLDRLAWDYIQFSNGNIGTVIGIYVNSSKASTVSLWRKKYIEEEGILILDVIREVNQEPFRSSTGEHVNRNRAIRLTIHDFLPDKLCDELHPPELSISYEKLAQRLDKAENIQRLRESESGGIESDRRPKKRRRVSSSPDRLLSEDEATFLVAENNVDTRTNADDDDFRLPGAKETNSA
ncbi:hypothetical protein F4861DRAFT_156325 [Xylaria intraflava]|nr:hypothetical protein F4861DRAFT_156325 [Xylaria intraflava]